MRSSGSRWSGLRTSITCFALLFIADGYSHAAQTYQATGMLLRTDEPHHSIVVSENSIIGYMDAMVMSYHVRDSQSLQGLQPGMNIEFKLTVGNKSSYVSDIHVHKFDSVARDPVQVRTLDLLESTATPKSQGGSQMVIGAIVPDFALTDQDNHRVTLSEFHGKVVVITFIYTRCPLPDYCFRLSDNFGQLQRRFQRQLGRELVLLSITFDPVHDRPETLRKYANIWKADPEGWRFLTGSLDEVKRICGLFGMNFWPDEGLLTHSLHTALIDRRGELLANIEGNQFTAKQLGDLVERQISKTP